jgi:hypothetical protein
LPGERKADFLGGYLLGGQGAVLQPTMGFFSGLCLREKRRSLPRFARPWRARLAGCL